MTRKVFVYAVRRVREHREILVFESHDEPGFEVPKGGVESGESLVEAARRELREEAGLDIDATRLDILGTVPWEGEMQTFFRAELSSEIPDRFDHIVTGTGIDVGLRYTFRWLPVDERLAECLVQGSNTFVASLVNEG